MRRKNLTSRGFTLIELVVVISVIITLSAIALPVMRGVQQSGRTARELGAGRNLMAAYHAYAAENDGQLLPGFGNFPATDETGAALGNPINRRYPWRLARYFAWDFRSVYTGDNLGRIEQAKAKSRSDYIYMASVTPSFGINAAFVGGDYQALPPDNAHVQANYGRFCVLRQADAVKPSQLVVFASACADFLGEKIDGYYQLAAPNLRARQWDTSFQKDAPPERHGHVDFRHNGRAAVAMLDGHIELLDFNQLDDMRRWANPAAEADQPDWMLQPNTTTP